MLAILLLCGFYSCDCYRSYSGVVKDADTDEPIEGAVFYSDKKMKFIETRTDSLGFYHGTINSGVGCFKPHYFTVVAEGYKDSLVEIGKEVSLRK